MTLTGTVQNIAQRPDRRVRDGHRQREESPAMQPSSPRRPWATTVSAKSLTTPRSPPRYRSPLDERDPRPRSPRELGRRRSPASPPRTPRSPCDQACPGRAAKSVVNDSDGHGLRKPADHGAEAGPILLEERPAHAGCSHERTGRMAHRPASPRQALPRPGPTGQTTMNKALSLALLVSGILLVGYGISATNSFTSSVSRTVNGSPTNRAMWLLVGGGAAAVVGLAGVVRGPRDQLELPRGPTGAAGEQSFSSPAGKPQPRVPPRAPSPTSDPHSVRPPSPHRRPCFPPCWRRPLRRPRPRPSSPHRSSTS